MADTAHLAADPRPELTDRAVALLSSSRDEPEELLRVRRQALATYQHLPVPRRSAHLWTYSDPARLWPTGPTVELGPVPPLHLPALDGRAAVAVLQPGTFLRATVDAAAAARGLRIARLADKGPHLQLLGTVVPARHGLFEALNLASFSTGALVYVPRGVQLAQPIHVQVAATRAHSAARLLVVVEEGARATLVEEHLGGDAEARVNSVSELLVAPGGELQHLLVQAWPGQVAGHQTVRACVERDAAFSALALVLGGGAAKLDLGAHLEGPGARSELVGVVLGDAQQRLDLHTAQEHRAPATRSTIDVKSVLGQRAEAAYTGRIYIARDAPGCQAYQENRNLLLSPQARAHTIPELEILTDDVACSHGATVAPVDPEPRFYLESRGLEPPAALRLVVESFVEKALARLPTRLRDDVVARLDPRLQALCEAAP